MPGAVRSDRPGRIAGITCFKHYPTLTIAETERAGAVREFFRETADHIGDSVCALDVRRRSGDDEVAARRKDRVRREREIDFAGKPESADVLEVRVRVEQLDEFEISPVQ